MLLEEWQRRRQDRAANSPAQVHALTFTRLLAVRAGPGAVVERLPASWPISEAAAVPGSPAAGLHFEVDVPSIHMVLMQSL